MGKKATLRAFVVLYNQGETNKFVAIFRAVSVKYYLIQLFIQRIFLLMVIAWLPSMIGLAAVVVVKYS